MRYSQPRCSGVKVIACPSRSPGPWQSSVSIHAHTSGPSVDQGSTSSGGTMIVVTSSEEREEQQEQHENRRHRQGALLVSAHQTTLRDSWGSLLAARFASPRRVVRSSASSPLSISHCKR